VTKQEPELQLFSDQASLLEIQRTPHSTNFPTITEVNYLENYLENQQPNVNFSFQLLLTRRDIWDKILLS